MRGTRKFACCIFTVDDNKLLVRCRVMFSVVQRTNIVERKREREKETVP